jgi:hypothetical protein
MIIRPFSSPKPLGTDFGLDTYQFGYRLASPGDFDLAPRLDLSKQA